MNRSPSWHHFHLFDLETRRLACGFVSAHINWATDAARVDCPACLEAHRRRANGADAAAAPRPLVAANG